MRLSLTAAWPSDVNVVLTLAGPSSRLACRAHTQPSSPPARSHVPAFGLFLGRTLLLSWETPTCPGGPDVRPLLVGPPASEGWTEGP